MVAAGAVTVALVARRRAPRHWGLFTLAGLVTGGAKLLAWDAVSGLQVG